MATGRLVRSKDDRMIAGVAGGLAAHFGWDATVIRVLWVVAVVFGGFGALAYVILWVVLPEGEPQVPAERIAEERYARGEITAEELEQVRANLRRSG
jgi:phage shock protein C